MSGPSDADLRAVFDEFDKDGDHKIQASELKIAMARLNRKLTDDQVAAMIQLADVDGDGEIDFEEFKRMMTQ